MRCAAIEALAAQPRHEMLKALEPLLNDPVLAVRRAAVRCAARGGADAVKPLGCHALRAAVALLASSRAG